MLRLSLIEMYHVKAKDHGIHMAFNPHGGNDYTVGNIVNVDIVKVDEYLYLAGFSVPDRVGELDPY